MAPEQSARHIQQQGEVWGRSWDAVQGSAGTRAGLAQALPLCLWQKLRRQLHLGFLPEKWASSLRKQIWEGNKKHKMWLLHHKIGDTILKCMLRLLEYNSFPKHNTLLCSSASLEDSAVQKGEPFSAGSWLKQTCLFLNSQKCQGAWGLPSYQLPDFFRWLQWPALTMSWYKLADACCQKTLFLSAQPCE